MQKLTDVDVAILGTGPAGLQAAIHAARKKVSVLVLGKETLDEAAPRLQDLRLRARPRGPPRSRRDRTLRPTSTGDAPPRSAC